MDGEQVEEEDDVGQDSCQLDVEEACRHLHLRLLQGAAEDEEVGPGEEEAGQERILNLFLLREDIVLIPIFSHTADLEKARNDEEDGEVDDEGDGQEEEGVEAEDNDGQGYRPDVEDSAGEEERKERAEGLDKVNLLLNSLLELLTTCCRLLLLVEVVEGEQLGTDLDHHQETYLEGRLNRRIERYKKNI